MARAFVLASTLWALACGSTEVEPGCEACLQSGGTWQIDECTNNCALQDTSCYVSACPAPCAADSCGTCFSESECEAVDCSWHSEGPANWCTGGAAPTAGTGGSTGASGGNGGGGDAGASCIPSCPEGDIQAKDANSCPGGWTCAPYSSCGTTIWCTWYCESYLVTCDPGDERIDGECPPGRDCYGIFGCGNTYTCVVGGLEPSGEGGAAGAEP